MNEINIIIIVAIIISLLIIIPDAIEVSGNPPNIQDLQNDSKIKSFCSSKGYNDGTSSYLDTFKNTKDGNGGHITWFEFQSRGTPFGQNSIFCFSNSTAKFYQKQYKDWNKR